LDPRRDFQRQYDLNLPADNRCPALRRQRVANFGKQSMKINKYQAVEDRESLL
jgi:hypothetical protein